jgi:hypothetical protein
MSSSTTRDDAQRGETMNSERIRSISLTAALEDELAGCSPEKRTQVAKLVAAMVLDDSVPGRPFAAWLDSISNHPRWGQLVSEWLDSEPRN